jgi:predicted methyltransferase
MQAVAHDPAIARKTGVPQKVGREFTAGLKPGSVKGLPEHTKKRGKK